MSSYQPGIIEEKKLNIPFDHPIKHTLRYFILTDNSSYKKTLINASRIAVSQRYRSNVKSLQKSQTLKI